MSQYGWNQSNKQGIFNNLFQSKQKKQPQQTKPISKISQDDQEYLNYFKNKFINGKDVYITDIKDWKSKEPIDLRRQVANLLESLWKKNSDLNNLCSTLQSKYESCASLKQFYDTIQQYFSRLEKNNFTGANTFLQSKLYNHPKLKEQMKAVSEKLNECSIKKSQLSEIENIKKKCCIYERILISLDNSKILINEISYSKQISQLDKQITKKIIQHIERLSNQQRQRKETKQNNPMRWLKFFLSIIESDFLERKVQFMLNLASKQISPSTQLTQILSNIRKFCCQKRKLFVEKKKQQKNELSSKKQIKSEMQSITQFQSKKATQLQEQLTQNIINLKKKTNQLFSAYEKKNKWMRFNDSPVYPITLFDFRQLQKKIMAQIQNIFSKNRQSPKELKSNQMLKNQQRYSHGKLKNSEDQSKKDSNQIKKIKDDIKSRQEKIQNLGKNESGMIKSPSGKNENDIKQLQGQIAALKKENKMLNEAIHILESDVKDNQTIIAEKNTDIAKKQNHISQMTLDLTQMNKKLNEANHFLRTQQEQIVQRDEKIKQLKSTIQIFQEQNQILKLQNSTLNNTLVELNGEYQKLKLQKRLPNFKSFNIQKKQQSTKNINLPTKNATVAATSLQTKANTSREQNEKSNSIDKKLQQTNASSQTESKHKKSLKLSKNLVNEYFIPDFQTDQERNLMILPIDRIGQTTNTQNEGQKVNETNQTKSQNDQIINQLNQQIQQLKSGQQQYCKSIEKLRSKLAEHINQAAWFSKLKEENQTLKEQLLLVKRFGQTKNIDEKNQPTLEGRQLMDTLKTNLNNNMSQITLLEEKASEIQEKLHHSENQNIRIVEQLENAQSENERMNGQYAELQKEKEKICKQFAKLQQEKIKLQQEIKETVQKFEEELKVKPMSDQLKLKEEHIKKLQAQKKKMKTDILTLELDLEQKTQHYNELRQKYKKQTTTLKNKIQELSTTTPGFQSEIQKLKNELMQKQQTLKSIEEQLQNNKTQIVKLQKSLQKSLQEQSLRNKRNQEQINQLKKQNQSNERQLQRLYEQKYKLESENQSLNQKLRNEIKANKEQTQKMKKDQQVQIKNLRLENARQVEEIKKQIKSAEFAQKVKSTTDTSNQSTALLKLQYEKLKKDLQASQKTKLALQESIRQLETKLKSLNAQLNDKTKKLSQANIKVKYMQDSQKKLQKSLVPYQGGIKQMSTIIYDRYFQNQALNQQPYKRYLLYDLIQQKTNKPIKRTKLIYSIDLLNKVNFHNYIDGKQNLLAVIKTTKGSIFGAFSTSKLERYFKQPAGTISFIYTFDTDKSIEHFNIDTKKPLNVKSFDWDEFFFIFGNAEIRWRFGEKRIHSSFGINNAYYETKGKDVSILLRQGNTREVPMDELEFYQVEFEK